jgi:ankyrin repeat protein
MAKKIDALNKELLIAAQEATKAKEIKDLIKKGAEVNCANEWGLTPILLAAQNNSAVVVLNALISAGADLGAVEPEFKSNALHLAANNSTNPKIISALIKAGCDMNGKNYLGETPLIMAVNGNKETKIVTALIKEGADVKATDYQNKSALDHAKEINRTYVINTLEKLGA